MQNIVILKQQARPERASACVPCTRRSECPAAGRESAITPTQHVIQAGTPVYAAGERFEGIYVVRSGFLKSYSSDSDCVVRVTGFYLPGEYFGMDGVESGQYGDHVAALDTTSVCRIPLEFFGQAQDPAVPLTLVKLMSRTIASERRLFFTLGKMTARRRMGVFLMELSERMAKAGYSPREFTLCMSRTDIANYLCLALETVSRLMSQLHAEGTIAIDRRRIRLLDMQALGRDELPERAGKSGEAPDGA